jgi:hypothetical protein
MTLFRDEAALQAAVARLALRHDGLLHYHTHDSRRSESGFPDSCFVGRRLMLRELKMTRKSRVRPEQKVWLARLADAGVDAGIWYADDYESGLIGEQLAELARREPADRHHGVTSMVPAVAKRLYLNTDRDNRARADLLWESGVASVEHHQWVNQARTTLAIVADELPASVQEYRAWLAAHDLGHGAGIAAVFSALRSDLSAPTDLERLLLPGGRL